MKYAIRFEVASIDDGFKNWESLVKEFASRADILTFLDEAFEAESEGQVRFRNIDIE